MRGKSKERQVNIFSDPVVWSEQAEELYLRSTPAEDAPVGYNHHHQQQPEIVGDIKKSPSSGSVFSLSTFSDISNSVKFTSEYPDSIKYGEYGGSEYPDSYADNPSIVDTINGDLSSDLPSTTNTKESEVRKYYPPPRKASSTEGTQDSKDYYFNKSDFLDPDEDPRCCGLFKRAFEEEMIFRRLVHASVCLLVLFAALATFVIIRSQLSGVDIEDHFSAVGVSPPGNTPNLAPTPSPHYRPTSTLQPLPTTSKPTAKIDLITDKPSVKATPASPTTSSSPTVSASASPTTSQGPSAAPTKNEIKDFIITASPISMKALDDSSSPQSLALDWLLSDPSTNYYKVSNMQEKIIQRWAMAVFYKSTRGDEWNDNKRWLTSTDECEWFTAAVPDDDMETCDDDGNLITLHMRHNNLRGTIPNEIGLLSDLVNMYLNDGHLKGTIPKSFAKLKKLRYLYLQVNDMEGSLPDELADMEKLEHLAIGRNNFEGKIPHELSELEALRVLDLTGNELRGTIPTVLGRLENLSSFHINRNKITGTVPTEIGRLKRLRTLFLQHNRLQGNITAEVCSLTERELRTISIDCSDLFCDCGCECD